MMSKCLEYLNVVKIQLLDSLLGQKMDVVIYWNYTINLLVVAQMLDVFQKVPIRDRIQDMQAYNETTNELQTAIHHKLDSGEKNFHLPKDLLKYISTKGGLY